MAEAGNYQVEGPGASSDRKGGEFPVTATDRLSEPASLEQIREALRGLKYGIVSIIVQDGVVVQIERTEKRRLR